MTDVTSWSETAASNNSASPAGFPEGMAPSGLNDSGREVMAAVARLYNRDHPVKTSGGAANAQTLTLDTAPASYIAGQRYAFKAGFTNTAAVTLNVNSLGAKNIFVNSAAGPVACQGGEIIANGIYLVDYDGTQLVLLNPTPQEGSWTPAIAGSSTAGTPTYSTQAGRYIRQGNVVHVWGNITLSNFTGAAGNAIITGLPFTASNVSGINYPVTLGMAGGSLDYSTGRTWLTAEIGANSTQIDLYEHGDATGSQALPVAGITTSATLRFGATYRIG